MLSSRFGRLRATTLQLVARRVANNMPHFDTTHFGPHVRMKKAVTVAHAVWALESERRTTTTATTPHITLHSSAALTEARLCQSRL